ncbi:MAG: tyrosine-type recombinase/integrase [Clostridia bacterium]|jgi:integrase/recombinase XerD|nr:tyrosine-type recombinase/integrase [Clostridiaceae bacterium]
MIGKYVDDYMDYLHVDRNLSANTIMSYNRDLKIFFDYLARCGIHDPEKVDKNELKKYLKEMRGMKKSDATILRYIATIKSYYSYLIDNNVCTKNPASDLDTPKLEKKPLVTIDENSMLKIINTPEKETVKGKRDRAILATLYYSGVRVSELIALTTGQYDSQSGIITISGKAPRKVSISRLCAEYLDDYLTNARPKIVNSQTGDTLFLNMKGNGMTRQGLWKIIKYYCKDIESEYEITPHTFRHSIAANMLMKGEDIHRIKEMLGHADIYSTKIYRK